ncbi:hypothetical protein TBK1r_25640 [Stieleria magnilauensis]|uniref:Uncharacterized protein n=1 Tax=Stieleria magnilauensis TaxID=2527963 RepID=A0ABX5XPF2_9BACT|nr:hypothetical protein TBK1r_25640 [Planctomycetes bacterium TBK1r]
MAPDESLHECNSQDDAVGPTEVRSEDTCAGGYVRGLGVSWRFGMS